MKAKFILIEDGVPMGTRAFGITWPYGVALDVPDDPFVRAKIAGNPHFEVVEEVASEPVAEVVKRGPGRPPKPRDED